jgi:hypothetical protein
MSRSGDRPRMYMDRASARQTVAVTPPLIQLIRTGIGHVLGCPLLDAGSDQVRRAGGGRPCQSLTMIAVRTHDPSSDPAGSALRF